MKRMIVRRVRAKRPGISNIKRQQSGIKLLNDEISKKFSPSMLDLGDIRIRMYFFGRAHSGSDILIHIPEEKLLLTGDLFLDGNWLPLFAGQPKLDIPRWIEVLHTVLDERDEVKQIIPGQYL